MTVKLKSYSRALLKFESLGLVIPGVSVLGTWKGSLRTLRSCHEDLRIHVRGIGFCHLDASVGSHNHNGMDLLFASSVLGVLLGTGEGNTS